MLLLQDKNAKVKKCCRLNTLVLPLPLQFFLNVRVVDRAKTLTSNSPLFFDAYEPRRQYKIQLYKEGEGNSNLWHIVHNTSILTTRPKHHWLQISLYRSIYKGKEYNHMHLCEVRLICLRDNHGSVRIFTKDNGSFQHEVLSWAWFAR